MDLSPDGTLLALAAHTRFGERLIVWNLKTGGRRELPARGCRADAVIVSRAWSADGQFFAVVPRGDSPCVYDPATWKPVTRWETPSANARGRPLAFNSDKTLLARLADGSLCGLKFPLSAHLPAS